MKKSLILLGFKGVGKTTLGKQIAEYKRCDFVDTDELLTKKHQKTPRQLYQEVGHKLFRSLELEILKELDFSKKQVISLGGGSVEAGFVFPTHTICVHLKRDKETLKIQLEKDRPAFLDENNFDAIYHRREKLYESIAEYTLDMTQSRIVEKLSSLF